MYFNTKINIQFGGLKMEYQSSVDVNSSILNYTVSSFSLWLTVYRKTCTWNHMQYLLHYENQVLTWINPQERAFSLKV